MRAARVKPSSQCSARGYVALRCRNLALRCLLYVVVFTLQCLLALHVNIIIVQISNGWHVADMNGVSDDEVLETILVLTIMSRRQRRVSRRRTWVRDIFFQRRQRGE